MPLLHWLTRDKDLKQSADVPFHLLEEVPSLSNGEGATSNMIIQDNNLAALKALLPFYTGKVQCIYIDPPYNTRSAFEQYDDNLEHAQWLSMMYPRLELLRSLLTEQGIIWVSIDDNEGHYLKVIMDEIFGRKNFVTSFVWQKVDSPNDNKVPITPDHEYVLCYAKSLKSALFKQKVDLSILEAFRQKDQAGRLYRDRLLKKNGKNSLRADRPTMFYPVIDPDGNQVFPIHDDGREANWAWAKNTVARLKDEGRLIWKKRGDKWIPYSREFAPKVPKRPHPTILLDVLTSRQAKAHHNDLFSGRDIFATPKPEQLVARVLSICTERGDWVLDSFLGSGTTAAVAHKMGRRYIGIELGPHAVSHCVPRIRKVIEGEQGGISEEVNWQGGGAYHFYRLGKCVFDENGRITPGIQFKTLAAHIWFSETGVALPKHPTTPLLGVLEGKAYYLLFNGILGDKTPNGGNVLTASVLQHLPSFKGPKIIFGEMSRLGFERLEREQITFRQIPYEVKVR